MVSVEVKPHVSFLSCEALLLAAMGVLWTKIGEIETTAFDDILDLRYSSSTFYASDYSILIKNPKKCRGVIHCTTSPSGPRGQCPGDLRPVGRPFRVVDREQRDNATGTTPPLPFTHNTPPPTLTTLTA